MRLIERLERDGALLFRWRSYLPLVLVPLAAIALADSARLEQILGEGIDRFWMSTSLAISVCGLAIRWVTVGRVPAGTSGRNTRTQRADTLNTTGMYSIVRNPLYLGNFFAFLGIVLATKVWWFIAIAVLAFWLYYERIIAAEEAYLSRKFGELYTAWVARTPVFIPRLQNWRASEQSFSFRTVLRREYNGIMTITMAFIGLEFAMDILVERERLLEWLHSDIAWVNLFAGTTLLFLALRTLKKRTHLLDVPGR